MSGPSTPNMPTGHSLPDGAEHGTSGPRRSAGTPAIRLDKRQAREALLRLLASQTDSRMAEELADEMAQLDPTYRDLSTWRIWAAQPTARLLAAVRQNSTLADWLKALPLLAPLSAEPVQATATQQPDPRDRV